MKRWNLWLMVALLSLIGTMALPVAADDEGEEGDRPKARQRDRGDDKEEGRAARPPKVRGMWAKLSLNEEQAARIAAIQARTKQKIAELKEQETQQIMAVLSPDQRQEVEQVEARRRAKMSVGGMKGALARMENKLERTRNKLDAAREGGDAEKIDALEKQVAEQEAKVAEYRDKVEQAQAQLGEDDDEGEERGRRGRNRGRDGDDDDEDDEYMDDE